MFCLDASQLIVPHREPIEGRSSRLSVGAGRENADGKATRVLDRYVIDSLDPGTVDGGGSALHLYDGSTCGVSRFVPIQKDVTYLALGTGCLDHDGQIDSGSHLN